MTKHESTVDTKLAEIASEFLEFVLSKKPDIGISKDDLTYSVALVLSKLQDNQDYAHEVLDDCYAVVNHWIP